MYKRALFVIALVAACGDDDPVRHLDGGVTIDSAMPMIDAPFAPVTLTIKLNGLPQTNIVVHFQNADSSLVATEMTDGTGTASHVMAPGGYVTAIDPFQVAAGLATSRLYTFAGVKPGDQLQLNDMRNVGTVSMTLTLPVQADPGIVRYVVDSPCSPNQVAFTSTGSGFQPTGSMSFRSDCTTTDILATSYDDNNEIVGYFFVAGETIASNGTLNYANKIYSTPTSRTYTYTNTGGLAPVTIGQHILSSKGELLYLEKVTTNDTATLKLPTFTNAIGLTQSTPTSTFAESLHILFDWGPLATTAFTTDAGARKLVDISAPVFDIATNTLTWTEGSGAAPDTDYIDIFGTRTTTNTAFGVDWQLVAPHTGASAKFPTLPVGAVDYNFDADDTVDPVNVGLLKVPAGGYDAVRANGFILESVVDGGIYGGLAAPTPGSAALVIWVEQLQARIRPSALPSVIRHRVQR